MQRFFYCCLGLMLLSGLIGSAYAQEKRLEFPLTPKTGYQQAVPMGSSGMILISEVKDLNPLSNSQTWQLRRYDRDLELLSEETVEMKGSMEYQGYDSNGRKLYVLFQKSNGTTYKFISLDMELGKLENFDIESLRRFDIESFKVMEENAFVLGKSKSTPTLLHFELKEQGRGNRVRILPASASRKSDMANIEKDTVNQLLNLSFANWAGNRSTLIIQSYDPSGEKLGQLALPQKEGYNPLTGKLSVTTEGNALVVGTYGKGGRRMATGLFVAEYDGPKQKYTQYYHFTDLSHFFDYLPEQKQERIERRQQKKEAQNKELQLQYRLLVHDLIYREGEYLLLAEAYYPTYRYEQFGYMNRYSAARGGAMPRLVFDGYQYTHALVASFNENTGKLLWDNSFELKAPKTFSLQQHVHLGFAANKELLMVYSNRGALSARVIEGDQVVEPLQTISLLEEKDEVIKQTYAGTVRYWFGDQFLAWGKQRVKDLGEDRGSKRSIFYVNKVPFRVVGD